MNIAHAVSAKPVLYLLLNVHFQEDEHARCSLKE